VIVAVQRAGKVAALLPGLAILDLFERDRTVVGVADIARNLGVHRSAADAVRATARLISNRLGAPDPVTA